MSYLRTTLPILGRHLLAGGALAAIVGLTPLVVSADTKATYPGTYHDALTDALDGEQQGLSAFAVTAGFARASGLGRIDTDNPENEEVRDRARAMLDALSTQDAQATSVSTGMQAEMTSQAAQTLGGPVSDVALEKVEVGSRSEEWYCLTEALYFEARGESRAGQRAVAEVILNRMDSARYPNTICGVVQQGKHRRNACQFSYNCDGRSNKIGNKPVFEELGKLAWIMMEGKQRTLTQDALFYHATFVKPRWAKKFVKTAKIGAHIFYRPPTTLSRN
ncbi:MAG: cell wall hydrolase [Pseudomonadota bacterium]